MPTGSVIGTASGTPALAHDHHRRQGAACVRSFQLANRSLGLSRVGHGKPHGGQQPAADIRIGAADLANCVAELGLDTHAERKTIKSVHARTCSGVVSSRSIDHKIDHGYSISIPLSWSTSAFAPNDATDARAGLVHSIRAKDLRKGPAGCHHRAATRRGKHRCRMRHIRPHDRSSRRASERSPSDGSQAAAGTR